MQYPLDICIEYADTKEYRQCLRNLFIMKEENYSEKIALLSSVEELDDVTIDEISFDEESSSLVMDYVESITISNELFKQVYQLAAARMFSTDLSIGVAILFSYDYLVYFHRCLVDFIRTPDSFTKDNVHYKNLLEKIS
jgi:hypothetical protein